jgi:predicted acyltransferase
MATEATPGVVGKAGRLLSIDQFRGYAILGMILVNFIGRFDVTPWILKHHKAGMSYNDTIAPVFIFVVGIGFMLSMSRRIQKDGLRAARRAAVKRYAILTFLGFIVYAGYFWDALSDIGLAGLLALPFIDKRPGGRLAAAMGYLAVYQALYSCLGYGGWVLANSLNGGPLGPLSWAFILLFGTRAYDLLATRDARTITRGCLAWGIGLGLAGWALRLEWPGIKMEWPFTQYGMSAPYALYSTGLCFLTLLPFYYLCDIRGFQFPHLTVLGENPLILYLAHGVLVGAGHLCLRSNAPLPFILTGFLCIYGTCYGLARWLRRKHTIIKI